MAFSGDQAATVRPVLSQLDHAIAGLNDSLSKAMLSKLDVYPVG
jgi:hypothetical protein